MRRALFWAWLALLVACGPTPRPRPPVVPPARVSAQDCAAIWQEELRREIDPAGLTGCLDNARQGATAAQIRANVRASAEWAALHAPVPVRPPVVKGRLHVEGRTMRYPDGFESALQGQQETM